MIKIGKRIVDRDILTNFLSLWDFRLKKLFCFQIFSKNLSHTKCSAWTLLHNQNLTWIRPCLWPWRWPVDNFRTKAFACFWASKLSWRPKSLRNPKTSKWKWEFSVWSQSDDMNMDWTDVLLHGMQIRILYRKYWYDILNTYFKCLRPRHFIYGLPLVYTVLYTGAKPNFP